MDVSEGSLGLYFCRVLDRDECWSGMELRSEEQSEEIVLFLESSTVKTEKVGT